MKRLTCALLAVQVATAAAGSPAAVPAAVPASISAPLLPGQHLASLDAPRYLTQRLGKRLYWVRVGGYNTTFLVGETGVLLFDPLGANAGPPLLAAIAEVTPLPVTAIFYSHHHLDHIGGAGFIVGEARKRGTNLRIFATPVTADEITRFGNHVPAPTDLVADQGRFSFDGVGIDIVSPAVPGHSRDSALAFVNGERVVSFIDAFDPGGLPFTNYGLAQDPQALEDNLRQLLAADWDFLNTGHGNIGSRQDVIDVLQYLTDVKSSVAEALGGLDYGTFEKPGLDHITVFNHFLAAVVEKAKARLQVKYGKQYGFEAAVTSHIHATTFQLMFDGSGRP